jgi:hypothetical protein
MRDKRLDDRPTDPLEQKLINMGHYLWRHRKEWPEKGVSSALEAIWEAKRELRVRLRREWLEYYENRKKQGQEALRAYREGRSGAR